MVKVKCVNTSSLSKNQKIRLIDLSICNIGSEENIFAWK